MTLDTSISEALHLGEALHHTTISLDVQGSSSRTNPEKLAMRRILYAAVDEAARFAGLEYSTWHCEDRGDGMLATVPAEVPKSRILGRWVEGLHRALLVGNRPSANQAAAGSAPVRLRAGIHAGEVHHDQYGVVGADIDIACRLADADIAKRVLATTPAAQLVVVVSDTVYQSVVRHYLEPSRYRRVSVTVKELSVSAWLYVPGYATPPLPGDPDPGNPAASLSPGSSGVPGSAGSPGASGASGASGSSGSRIGLSLPMIGSVFGPASIIEAARTHHQQIDHLYRHDRT